MAKDASKKGKGRGARKQAPVETMPSIFTADDLNALLMSMARLSDDQDDPADEALDLAQEKAFDAMEAPTSKERISLAREALALSPRCADAHLVLAHEAHDADEALDLYRRAVAAGAEAVGDAAFQDDVGLFWGLIQTRPYMRARHELALALWEGGNGDEAIDHYRDMLRLNPNDNQGIRYLLMDALLELGRQDEATALLKTYKDDGSAAWAWSGALLAFRRTPGGSRARKALIKANDVNPFVVAYLVGDKSLPRVLPDFIGMGDENEAIAYVHGADGAWIAVPGAKAWVAEVLVAATSEQGQPGTDTDRA